MERKGWDGGREGGRDGDRGETEGAILRLQQLRLRRAKAKCGVNRLAESFEGGYVLDHMTSAIFSCRRRFKRQAYGDREATAIRLIDNRIHRLTKI